VKRIRDILARNKTPVTVLDDVTYKQVTIRTNYKGVVLRGTQSGSSIGTKNQSAVSAGQFILSRIDARNGAFGIVPEELEGAIVTNDFLAFDINEDEVEREFFNVFLQSPQFLDACIKASRGNTNRKRVDEDFFLNYEVNLPDLAEQHSLIQRINQARSQLGIAHHEITRQEHLLSKLKQAILLEAIQGRLTAEWRAAHPDVEPASKLLQRIQTEKARLIAAKKLRPEKPLPKITPAEIPFEIPKGWEWCRFSNLYPSTSGGTPARTHPAYWGGSVPWLKSGEMTDDFIVDPPEEMITEAGLQNSSTSLFPEGTLLIAMYGATAGKLGILRYPSTTNQAVCGMFTHDLVKTRFSFFYLQSQRARMIEESWGNSQPNISQGYLRNYPFPLPPLAEQAAIVERVEALMTTCRALEAEIEHARTHAAHLLQAVLKEAFAPAAA
jgi:type I restriction enzyme S subunit